MNAISKVMKNRDQIPKREYQILTILVTGLGILHTFIFYITAGRVFPDDQVPRLALMILMVAFLIFTVIYVRFWKWVKKYNL